MRVEVVTGDHWVRVGLLGSVGCYRSADGLGYRRAARVVCRTRRGLELGEVLARVERPLGGEPDGQLLRPMTDQDGLLEQRLLRNREQALAACQRQLDAHRLPLVLMDVEILFDGSSVVFYFLGDPSPELDSVITDLTNVYDGQVQFRRFTETLAAGCGPGCGTTAAAGCGAACSSCSIAGACGTNSKPH